MFGFGYKLLLSGLLDTLYKNIYYVIIGRCYSPAQLGQYSRAEQFNMIFSSNLTSIVQRVSYPVLSSIQEEPERLREAYRQIIKTTMLVTFACMLGLAAVAKPLIIILIGEKWLPAVSFLQIICFSGMLYPLHAINLNILQVKGRSDLFLKLEIIKKTIAVFPIPGAPLLAAGQLQADGSGPAHGRLRQSPLVLRPAQEFLYPGTDLLAPPLLDAQRGQRPPAQSLRSVWPPGSWLPH